MTRNYQLVYYVAEKCGNYRDTGVSKKMYNYLMAQAVLGSQKRLCPNFVRYSSSVLKNNTKV